MTTREEASRAQNAVSKAVMDGTLEKQPCEECGAEPADAHHDDYSRPLEVRWLCRKHHAAWHQENPSGVAWKCFQLRLTPEQHAQLKREATANRRSIQKELTHRLFGPKEVDEGWPVPAETQDYFRPDFGTKLGTKPEGKKKK